MFMIFLDLHKLIKYSNRSSKWKDSKISHGWKKEQKESKQLSTLSKVNKLSNLPISDKSIKICLTNLSGIEKLKKKDCTKSFKIFTKTSRTSKKSKTWTTRVNSGLEEAEIHRREPEVHSRYEQVDLHG